MKIFLHAVLLIAVSVTCNADDLKEIAHFGDKIIYAVIDSEAVTGADAKTRCKRHGLTQIAIENAQENEAIYKFILKRAQSGDELHHGWLGGSNDGADGAWYWVANRKNLGPYLNWDDGQPVKGAYNNCMYISPNEGKWRVHYCDIAQGLAICEKKL